ncbi:hypothetical protein [Calothrix sp. NIES-2100]
MLWLSSQVCNTLADGTKCHVGLTNSAILDRPDRISSSWRLPIG